MRRFRKRNMNSVVKSGQPVNGNVANPISGASVEDEVIPIVQKYFPGLHNCVKAILSVIGAMSLKDRTRPLTLILETPSGYGKTAVLQMTFPNSKCKWVSLIYRSDSFTTKAFVSHAANVKRAQLDKNDLLPKLKGKVLVTKELAPIFRGREDDLVERFSILISVLDGQGFTSDSGTHGRRGYPEK